MAGCHTCWQLHGNQMKKRFFFFLFFCSAPNLVDPFHTVVVFFPATVEFEESRSLVANTWRTKYFESPRRILVVDRSKNSKKKNSVIFLGLFKQRIEFSIHSKTALNTREGNGNSLKRNSRNWWWFAFDHSSQTAQSVDRFERTPVRWRFFLCFRSSLLRTRVISRITSGYNFPCVDTFSFVFFCAFLRSQVITHRKTIWNIIWRNLYIQTQLFKTGNSLLRF